MKEESLLLLSDLQKLINQVVLIDYTIIILGDNAMFHNILTLNNGIKIPQLGLGTWFIHDDIVVDAIKEAVNVGYRHFDTAQAYGNEVICCEV